MPASIVVLATVLSGCAAGQGSRPVTASDIVQKLRDTAKTTQSVQSTVDLSLNLNKQGIQTLIAGFMPSGSASTSNGNDFTSKLPDNTTATVKLWEQAASGSTPAKARMEIVSASVPGVDGLTLVYDGQKAYAYDPAHKTLYTGTPDTLAKQIPAQVQAALSSIDPQKELDTVLNAADVKLDGTEKVAGVDAYKLEITPKPDAATTLGIPQAYQMEAGVLIKDLHFTLWIDQNRWIPLKFEADHPSLGQFTAADTAVDVNKTIDPAEFVLQVGSDVKQVDIDKLAQNAKPQSLTLPQARDAAKAEGWSLLEVGYPAGTTVVGVTGNKAPAGESKAAANTIISIDYSSSSTDFTVYEAKVSLDKQLVDKLGSNSKAQHVTVRGTDALAYSPAGSGWTALAWQEKGSGLYVAITGKLSLDQATQIANGLK